MRENMSYLINFKLQLNVFIETNIFLLVTHKLSYIIITVVCKRDLRWRCFSKVFLGWRALKPEIIKMSGNIAFLVVLKLFIMLKRSLGNTCAVYEAHYKDTSLNDMVLSGHSFKNFSGVHFGQCSRHCGETCRCRSFNLDYSGGSGYCELNDAGKEESPYDLRVKKGFIHVSFRPLTSVSSLYSWYKSKYEKVAEYCQYG